MRQIIDHNVEAILLRDAKLYCQWVDESTINEKSEKSYYYGCYCCICDILDSEPFALEVQWFTPGAYYAGYADYSLFIIEKLLGYTEEIVAPHAAFLKTGEGELPSKRVKMAKWLQEKGKKQREKLKEEKESEKNENRVLQ